MDEKIEVLIRRYNKAKERRSSWESHWRECYEYALPQRGGVLSSESIGGKKTDRLFDGTAPDAVDQLSASLLSQLTPPWARWFGLTAGSDLSAEERDEAGEMLDKAGDILRSNFDRSNFAVEMHQCFLDLVTVGTASLLFEESPLGESSAFRFTAVPLSELAVEEGSGGRIDTTFRRTEITLEILKARFPAAELPVELLARMKKEPDFRVVVIEAVVPRMTETGQNGFSYTAFIEEDAVILKEGVFDNSPFINFRWLKAPGEIYGRSPVMKSLPDIKTANKVVELVLKNATIAVTGIWQADDDGVLNPANIKLVPGSIIPKAVGSKGLTPLEAPGRFDISEIVLDDLRSRIRHAMLVDRLAQTNAPAMSATEVLERSAEVGRILGATYGRLQSELLTPLVLRAVAILRRRGEIPDLIVDGRMVELQYKSPLAMQQSRQDANNIVMWLDTVSKMGEEAAKTINSGAAARWLGRILGVPSELINETGDENV